VGKPPERVTNTRKRFCATPMLRKDKAAHPLEDQAETGYRVRPLAKLAKKDWPCRYLDSPEKRALARKKKHTQSPPSHPDTCGRKKNEKSLYEISTHQPNMSKRFSIPVQKDALPPSVLLRWSDPYIRKPLHNSWKIQNSTILTGALICPWRPAPPALALCSRSVRAK